MLHFCRVPCGLCMERDPCSYSSRSCPWRYTGVSFSLADLILVGTIFPKSLVAVPPTPNLKVAPIAVGWSRVHGGQIVAGAGRGKHLAGRNTARKLPGFASKLDRQ